MKNISIFNQVIGPVMRGPSSSHTAGAFFIARIARSLLGDMVKRVEVTFDPDGSYARTYHEQAADLAFVCGIIDIELTDERFFDVFDIARRAGVEIKFAVKKLEQANHPNTMDIKMVSEKGQRLSLRAISTGGGSVEIVRLEGWEVDFNGTFYEIAIEAEAESGPVITRLLRQSEDLVEEPSLKVKESLVLVSTRSRSPFGQGVLSKLEKMPGFRRKWLVEPVCPVVKKQPLFQSAQQMIKLAQKQSVSLGQLALEYESEILGLPRKEILVEADRRFRIMQSSVGQGLELEAERIQFLKPSAGKILRLEKEGRLPIGGSYLRAGARALAVMHINGKCGVVCAAPTGGSAGTLPGVLVTLLEDERIGHEKILLSLLAAGAIGAIVAQRATFAAEIAGCQVEIGAAGAMAAAAVVEAFGGNAGQAADAAAIAFQNIMGSVCDLVQGKVEIPCHTRNALGAANAFLCAGL
ncbi:MAG TPA: L-serine ammonia-lyase, iron-sulfur-dependent, subunit alpha, partial [Candidatus Saccharicenans sp.]|nr:L-serine ammonia-lyase, iron-sulfur-dependent, subunit alpha [Candidatus Saccharicenans sp.]